MTSLPPVPVAVVGEAYSHQFTSTYMSPVRWSVTAGTLPAGLALNPQSGLLSGTPTQAGNHLNITVSASNGLAAATETFSIAVAGEDSAPSPAVSVGDATVHEGASGTRAAVFTVSLSQPSSSTVTVEYATGDGTATAPSDYQARTGTLSFAAGASSAVVKVRVPGDTTDEGDETFALTLSSPSGVGLGDATGTGRILDDDPGTGRRLSIGDVAVHEGDDGTRVAVFNVSLSKASTGYVTVSYATAKGTAVGTDFTAKSGSLTFSPGATSLNVKIVITPDTVTEGNEAFNVKLTSGNGATIADGVGEGTIVDDD